MPEGVEGLILDTHIWVWLNTGSSNLSQKIVDKIDAARSGGVFIPAIVVWEICTLVAKGRITLKIPTLQWLEEGLSQTGIELVPLVPAIAVESTLLPGEFHGDPADRLIVATARINGLSIVTRDAKILQYCKDGHVSAIKG